LLVYRAPIGEETDGTMDVYQERRVNMNVYCNIAAAAAEEEKDED